MATRAQEKHFNSLLAQLDYDRQYYALVDRPCLGAPAPIDIKLFHSRLRDAGLQARYFRSERFFRLIETTARASSSDDLETWLHLAPAYFGDSVAPRCHVEVGMYWIVGDAIHGSTAAGMARDAMISRREKPPQNYPKVPYGSLADCPVEVIVDLWRQVTEQVAANNASLFC